MSQYNACSSNIYVHEVGGGGGGEYSNHVQTLVTKTSWAAI